MELISGTATCITPKLSKRYPSTPSCMERLLASKHSLSMNIPDAIEQRMTALAVPLASEIDAFKHTSVAKRIHAWYADAGNCDPPKLEPPPSPFSRTWQSFPIGMGTAAVYLCLCNLHVQPQGVRDIAVSSSFAIVFEDFH
ncbi:uncharacterized protein EI90DRAFT_1726188 [Cantharellus anzutake]|uniref:uncharacterized protein n=1 Tax=Cantharellus anzutake TaxID=1750568 RepID=UPI00190385C6|nr:uncharacterized protein EI90DRAFT_1726188 [Cantharellus anzutake]KAF8341351.1 hypothetical protein EI90DRAFT_1726188 [Cantharellus anzutake]